MVSEAGRVGTDTGWTCSNFWICQIQKRFILWGKRDFEPKSINISSVASVSDPIGWLAAAEVSPKGSWLQPNRVLSEYGCNQSAPRRSAVATEGGSAAHRQIYNVLCDSHKRETAILILIYIVFDSEGRRLGRSALNSHPETSPDDVCSEAVSKSEAYGR